MPKVYEQQITAQAAGGGRVKYDKIQDFITPALENANKATQNAMDAMRKIGDSRAASELDKAAKDAASEIENWSDFSKPENTISDMMSAGMKKYDDAMSKLDSSTRNRISMYNPKSREIFELKVQEQANKTVFDYSFKQSMQSIDHDVGRMITETATGNLAEDPFLVKSKMLAHLELKKSTMRPADYLVYEQAVKSATEQGLVEWYIAQGYLEMAKAVAQTDAITGDVSEVTRARWVKSIDKLMAPSGKGASEGDGSSEDKENFLDYYTSAKEVDKDGMRVVEPGGSADEGLARMGALSAYAESGTQLPEDLQQYADVVLAGGKTYNELMKLPLSKRVEILHANNERTIKAANAKEVVRTEFWPLENEFDDITDDEGVLKEGADISRLKSLVDKYDERGLGDLLLAWPENADMKRQYNAIKTLISKERSAQGLALSQIGTNMSFAVNNPHMDGFFDAPATKEQAKVFNTPERAQKLALTRRADGAIKALNMAPNGLSDGIAGDLNLLFYGKQGAKPLSSISYDEMGNAINNDAFSLPVDGYIDQGKLDALDTLEKQTLYLNEMVYPTRVIERLVDKGRVPSKEALEKLERLSKEERSSSGKITRAEDIQERLDKALAEGHMTEQRHAELSRYIYNLSQGMSTRTFPCLFPNSEMPLNVWNQCLAAKGLGTVKHTAEYDPNIDTGWHDAAALLRRATMTKFQSGEVGDVAQLITVFIQNSVRGGNEKYFGIPSGKGGSLTDAMMRDVYNEVESFYAKRDELHNLVDLTNNSSLYSKVGKKVDGKVWDPANPLPETTTDLQQSKQYEMLGVFENVLSKKFGTPIQFSDEMKMQIAENVRRVSKGERSTIKNSIEKDIQELTADKANMNYERLTGAQK